MICILAIESSYDDSCLAIFDSNKGIIFNHSINHKKINIKFGGIIPDLSSQIHLKNLLILIKKILNINNNLINNIDYIAYTEGPGLIGCLIIGASIALSLSLAYKKPIIAINHLEAHLYSPFINNKNKLIFPFIGLIISGANTILVYCSKFSNYYIMGKTKDDALGEIIDKIGRKLNLNYPWSKSLSKIYNYGNKKYIFPIAMIKNKNLNFSFSGLKTYVFNKIKKQKKPLTLQIKANIAKSFFISIFKTLILKCNWALKFKKKTKLLIVTGGVSSNLMLRKYMFNYYFNKIKIVFPNVNLCTDNAVMIAYLAFLKIKYNKIILSNVNNIYVLSKNYL